MGVGFPRDIVDGGGARGGHVRLRPAHAQRAKRVCVHGDRPDSPAKQQVHRAITGPIEAGCDCYACRNFTRGAIRHFFFAGEMLGPVLVSVHNIRFYQRLMADIRQAIARRDFEQFWRTDPRCLLGPPGSSEDVTRARMTIRSKRPMSPIVDSTVVQS